MPLPRFDRLPPETRAAVLAAARGHFARDGKDAASFNRIIAEAGISKTSAYHYFGSKDDLFAADAADTAARALAALGPWEDAATERRFWEQLTDGTARLSAHLRDHPDDRAVLAAAGGAADDGGWTARLVENGLRIGLIDPLADRELLTAATRALIDAADAWALARPPLPAARTAETLRTLLTRLWTAPRP
ncbi:helix-turn-helix domain-containing protein [Streptomyces globosus]|uniref:TetR/AcrR family transcriptional regulator n=1 Tax=Streptomyces globosus TaxID=68209 RepID=UPI0031E413A6